MVINCVIQNARWDKADCYSRIPSCQNLFSVTLALSVNTLTLTVFEILDVMSPTSRWVMWKLDLSVLSVLVIIILPLSFFNTLLRCGWHWQRVGWHRSRLCVYVTTLGLLHSAGRWRRCDPGCAWVALFWLMGVVNAPCQDIGRHAKRGSP